MKNSRIRVDEKYDEKQAYNEYSLMKELKANNIIKERVELYRDFTVNLICYAHTTYFGKKLIHREQDIKGHFNWAFNKVVDEFAVEGIHFKGKEGLAVLNEYFFEYFMQQFYCFDDNAMPEIKDYMHFWDNIFSVQPKKQKNIMIVLVDLYTKFDVALEGNKNLIENLV